MTSLDELAPALGGLSWVSAELFALEGRWAAAMSADGAVVHLATHSRHYGWHASLWADALPDSVQLDSRRHIAPPHSGWAAALTLAERLDGDDPSGDARRLAFLYRGVVPRAASLLESLSGRLGGPADAAVARVLGHVRPDVVDDLVGGCALLESALRTAGSEEFANSVTTALDQAFRT